jgi:hypothetical protein
MAEIAKKELQDKDDSNYWSSERVNELMRKADEEGLDFKSVENPFHDNNPEFKRANILFEYTKEELIEIKKCAEDVTYFSKYCQVMTDTGLNYIKLRDYQTSVLKEYQAHRFSIFVAPRQIGKCLLPTTNVIDGKNSNVSINSLIPKKNNSFLSTVKRILYKIYSRL